MPDAETAPARPADGRAARRSTSTPSSCRQARTADGPLGAAHPLDSPHSSRWRPRPAALVLVAGSACERRRGGGGGARRDAAGRPRPVDRPPAHPHRAAGRRCRSSWSSAASATPRRTTRSCTRAWRACRTATTSSATGDRRRLDRGVAARRRHDLQQASSDTAAYWAPTLFDHGQPVTPLGPIAYYRPAPGVDPTTLQPFPAGLMMIAGDSTATARSRSRSRGWTCGTSSDLQTDAARLPAGRAAAGPAHLPRLLGRRAPRQRRTTSAT